VLLSLFRNQTQHVLFNGVEKLLSAIVLLNRHQDHHWLMPLFHDHSLSTRNIQNFIRMRPQF